MGSIYKRGKNWYIDIRVKRRRVRKRVGPSKELAQLALKDAEVKAARMPFMPFYRVSTRLMRQGTRATTFSARKKVAS